MMQRPLLSCSRSLRYPIGVAVNPAARFGDRNIRKAHSRAAAFFVRYWHTSTFSMAAVWGTRKGGRVPFGPVRQPCTAATFPGNCQTVAAFLQLAQGSQS